MPTKTHSMSFDEKIFWLTLKYGAVKYVPMGRKGYFLLLKVPFVRVRHGQKRHCGHKHSIIKFDPRECAIVHKDKIFIRWQGNDVEKYLRNYKGPIANAPLFLVSNIIGRDKVKITSKDYITPLKRILRRVGLLKETVGKNKKRDPYRERFRDFIIRENNRKKYSLLELADVLADKVNSLFPDDDNIAKKYRWSSVHIWRILKQDKKLRIT